MNLHGNETGMKERHLVRSHAGPQYATTTNLSFVIREEFTKKLPPIRSDPVPEMVWTVTLCWQKTTAAIICANLIKKLKATFILSTQLTLPLFTTSLSAPRASVAQALLNSPKPPMVRYSLSNCLAAMSASALIKYKKRGLHF